MGYKHKNKQKKNKECPKQEQTEIQGPQMQPSKAKGTRGQMHRHCDSD